MGKIHNICLQCNKEYYGQGKKFCSNKCRTDYSKGKSLNISEEHRKFLSESMKLKTKGKKLSEEHKKKISESGIKVWENSEYKEKMKKTHLGRVVTEETKEKIRIGNTGIKRPYVSNYNKTRPKISGWHHTEESKQKIREKVSGTNNGQYGKPPVNITPFYFIDKNNRKFVLRSSWEEKLAKYFDDNEIKWDYEKITYKLSNGDTYTPDFFTDECLYEVKGYFYEKSREKFENFIKDYPDIKIILANREYLEKILHIKL